ncbi:MAG: hypothetical protein GEU94_06115 [Micromonosporaceae bacterium]|nr:hypothetical protein [Micromonosporaceae bacterium]
MERVARRDPHTAVKQELLVRYLDAWTPTVLRSHRRATYVEASRDGSALAALRVFGEFADRLAGHHLDVVVLSRSGDPDAQIAEAVRELGEPAGLSLRTVVDPAELELAGPTFAHVELTDENEAWTLAEKIATQRGSELLLTLTPSRQLPLTGGHVAGGGSQKSTEPEPEVTAYRRRLRKAGLPHVAHAELVDDGGRAQLLLFATGVDKHLPAFKEALWAVDEYAGIRYRDPRDPERALVDISLTPQLAPLRRALLEVLSDGGERSVADLQRHALTETLYRPADAVRVLTTLASQGAISREPEKGRLTPRTTVRAERQARTAPAQRRR